MLETDYEIWVNIVKAMKTNKRPTIHGTLLRGLSLDKYTDKQIFKHVTNYRNYEFSPLAKDYLQKRDGTLRDNAYLASIDVLLLTNYLCYKIFQIYGDRNNVYYSGNMKKFDMFYEKPYSHFQKDLFDIYSSYA